jgi:hypothetical protein
MRNINQGESSDTSVRLLEENPEHIQRQVYAIAKLLARVAVDEYINSVLDMKNRHSDNNDQGAM